MTAREPGRGRRLPGPAASFSLQSGRQRGCNTVQALWTQAREGLEHHDRLILEPHLPDPEGRAGQCSGAGNPRGGRRSTWLDLGRPDIDWGRRSRLRVLGRAGGAGYNDGGVSKPALCRRGRLARAVPRRGRACRERKTLLAQRTRKDAPKDAIATAPLRRHRVSFASFALTIFLALALLALGFGREVRGRRAPGRWRIMGQGCGSPRLGPEGGVGPDLSRSRQLF